MARFQTRLADLLEQQTGQLPEYARLSWRKLGELTGVSAPTLKSWADARVGSDQYLERIEGDVLGKLMSFFDSSMEELIVAVVEEDVPPHLIQETASAALIAA